MKLFASLLAVGILAAPSAFAQSYMSPGPNCRPGDPNCPAPLNTYGEEPIATGRDATDVAPVFGPSGRPTIRSEQSIKRGGATGTDGSGSPPPGSGNSNK